MYVYIYISMHVYIYIYIYVGVYIHMYTYMYGCIYMCMCMCMYMCMCICIYVIYMYVYIHIIYLYIACMCSLFHLALGNEDGMVQLVYESACCLARGIIFDRRKDRGVVCVFSIFDANGSVCVCVCVYTHTHIHTAQMGYLDVGCEPRSRDETPGGPKESRWTKSQRKYIRICVQSTHVYIHAKR